jgi:MerR family transcriptional regulator/heat shock protein HspR
MSAASHRSGPHRSGPHRSGLLQPIDNDAPLFVISVAAQLAGMHPQTLRTYDRMGLVSPRRTSGRGRRYSPRDVARLRLIQRLSQDEGINLEGIRRILAMENEIEELRIQVKSLTELLSASRAAPPASRVFTADTGGGVHIAGRPGRAWGPPRALPVGRSDQRF